jgi:hypothetical protein
MFPYIFLLFCMLFINLVFRVGSQPGRLDQVGVCFLYAWFSMLVYNRGGWSRLGHNYGSNSIEKKKLEQKSKIFIWLFEDSYRKTADSGPVGFFEFVPGYTRKKAKMLNFVTHGQYRKFIIIAHGHYQKILLNSFKKPFLHRIFC